MAEGFSGFMPGYCVWGITRRRLCQEIDRRTELDDDEIAVSTVTPVTRRSSWLSSIWSSTLTATSVVLWRGISLFISARMSPDGGGMDTGAVCAVDIALIPLPARREGWGLAPPFSKREDEGRFIRVVTARG
jgi:hypothetical protein